MQDYCIEAARDAGFDVDKVAVRTSICDLAAEFGVGLMLKGLQACVDNGVVKLAYLKKVLPNMRDNVPKPAAPQPAGRGHRVFREADYEQRDYEPSTGMPDWMREMMENEDRIRAGAAEECGGVSEAES